jgi:hypothetical protein
VLLLDVIDKPAVVGYLALGEEEASLCLARCKACASMMADTSSPRDNVLAIATGHRQSTPARSSGAVALPVGVLRTCRPSPKTPPHAIRNGLQEVNHYSVHASRSPSPQMDPIKTQVYLV